MGGMAYLYSVTKNRNVKKLLTNLTFWVLLAISSGALLGHFFPDKGVAMQPLGKYFIEVVKVFINPIIFLTISLGISGMNDLKKVGRVGGKAILYFEIVTTVALLIGIVVAHFIQPGTGVNTNAIQGGDISKFTKSAEAFSWLKFLQDNLTIQVLIFSILFGIFLSKFNRKDKVIEPMKFASKYIFKGLHIVMLFAPIGAFGGMAFTNHLPFHGSNFSRPGLQC